MKENVNKYCKNAILMSVLLCIIAILLIINPLQSLTIITTLFGAVLICTALIQIISYSRADKEFKAFSFKLILGLITLTIGLIFVFNPTSIYNFIITISGIWIIIESIIRLQITININSNVGKKINKSIIFSVITLVLGIVMLINPFAAIEAVGMVAGISLLLNEIFNIIGLVTVIKNNKKVIIDKRI